jgi:hypothetical protein
MGKHDRRIVDGLLSCLEPSTDWVTIFSCLACVVILRRVFKIEIYRGLLVVYSWNLRLRAHLLVDLDQIQTQLFGPWRFSLLGHLLYLVWRIEQRINHRPHLRDTLFVLRCLPTRGWRGGDVLTLNWLLLLSPSNDILWGDFLLQGVLFDVAHTHEIGGAEDVLGAKEVIDVYLVPAGWTHTDHQVIFRPLFWPLFGLLGSSLGEEFDLLVHFMKVAWRAFYYRSSGLVRLWVSLFQVLGLVEASDSRA